MPTEDLRKGASIVRELLSNQYGGVGIALASVWILGNLAPEQFEQAVVLIGHLNTNVSFLALLFFFAVYVNKTFFAEYLAKERGYATNLKSVEKTLAETLQKCLTVSQGVEDERTEVKDRLQNIDSVLSRFYSDFKDHESYAENVSARMELEISPLLKELLTLYKEGNYGSTQNA